MKKLKVIDFIKQTPTWREILSAAPYNLTIADADDFTILKYSQIDSDFTQEIVRECRGIIIDKDYNLVCVPFFKFANYGELYADKIDWATARVEEKIDGSLIKIWNYKGKWITSTNGTIYAESASVSPLHGGKGGHFSNYAELFAFAANDAGLCYENLNPQYTYMFELCSPYNRIVVPHDEIKIYHIGTRDNVSLQELDIDIGIAKPRTFQFNNMDDVIEMTRTLKYCDEGYVVRDANYNRVKIKSPAYVAVHHLVSDMSDKKLLDLMRKNETAEFLTYFPEYQNYVDNLLGKIAAFESYINETLKHLQSMTFETRKNYAEEVLKTKVPDFFFQYFDKKISTPAEWLWRQSNNKILENLNKL